MRQPSYPISYNLSCTLHPVNNQPSIALLKNRPKILAKSHIQYCWLLRNLLFNYFNYLWCTSLFSHFWSVFWCTYQFIQSFLVSLLMYLPVDSVFSSFLVSLLMYLPVYSVFYGQSSDVPVYSDFSGQSLMYSLWYSVQVWVYSVFSGQFLMFFYSLFYVLLLFLIVGPFQ